jgi:hypothetical protein
MMNYMMGEKTFMNGLRVSNFDFCNIFTFNSFNYFKNYLQKYQFGNARQDNLWTELEKVFNFKH